MGKEIFFKKDLPTVMGNIQAAQPDNIDSEVEQILDDIPGDWQIIFEAKENAHKAIKNLMLEKKLEDAKKYKEYYDKKIAQEANKAQADILIWATGGIKEFTEEGKIAIPAKIKELLNLTADKEQADG